MTFDRAELGRKYPITVVDYAPRWPDLYETEARSLRTQFPQVVRRTEHFGSTAVPGLASKPVIDILVEITSFEAAQREIIPALDKQGYVYMWSADRSPGHMMFVKGYGPDGYLDNVQRYHLHMAPRDHSIWDRLLFRDYLRRHPDAARRCAELKRRLADLHRNDREAYTDAKAQFVAEITRAAKAEAANAPGPPAPPAGRGRTR